MVLFKTDGIVGIIREKGRRGNIESGEELNLFPVSRRNLKTANFSEENAMKLETKQMPHILPRRPVGSGGNPSGAMGELRAQRDLEVLQFRRWRAKQDKLKEELPGERAAIAEDVAKLKTARSQLSRRETVKNLQELTNIPENEIWGLYFDGRKDKTISYQIDEAGNSHRRCIKEEHISNLCEPASTYVGHATMQNGSGRSVAFTIFDFLEKQKADIGYVVAVGSDGTATNTGVNNH